MYKNIVIASRHKLIFALALVDLLREEYRLQSRTAPTLGLLEKILQEEGPCLVLIDYYFGEDKELNSEEMIKKHSSNHYFIAISEFNIKKLMDCGARESISPYEPGKIVDRIVALQKTLA